MKTKSATSNMRLDLYIKNQLKISRHRAEQMIRDGYIRVNAKTIKKTSYLVKDKDQVEVVSEDHLNYVSRAGRKLEKAMEELKLDVANKTCLDIGQSTGGFSQCLLNKGAALVIGIDVGKEQLADLLKKEERLISVEGFNIKDLNAQKLRELSNEKDIELVVSDLSFISTLDLLPHLDQLIETSCHFLLLIKPQFELGAKNLNKKGLVKDKGLYLSLEEKVKKSCKQLAWQVLDYIPSEIKGGDGNQEFFLYAKK